MHVFRTELVCIGLFPDPCQIELLATAAFGRRAVEEVVTQQLMQQGVVDGAEGGEAAVAVEAFAGVGFNPGVHEYVAGAAVEADDTGLRSWRR